MSIKNMKCVTVEEVHKLREAAMKLESERDALASLAAERAQFILNAVELGYCQLPDSDTPDSAHDTYERCKLADSEAVARRDARMKAEALEDAADGSHVPADSALGMNHVSDWLHGIAMEYRHQAGRR